MVRLSTGRRMSRVVGGVTRVTGIREESTTGISRSRWTECTLMLLALLNVVSQLLSILLQSVLFLVHVLSFVLNRISIRGDFRFVRRLVLWIDLNVVLQ